MHFFLSYSYDKSLYLEGFLDVFHLKNCIYCMFFQTVPALPICIFCSVCFCALQSCLFVFGFHSMRVVGLSDGRGNKTKNCYLYSTSNTPTLCFCTCILSTVCDKQERLKKNKCKTKIKTIICTEPTPELVDARQKC